MKCLVGLGNPGKKYSQTRHNIGFLVIQACIQKWGASPLSSQHHGHLHLIRPNASHLSFPLKENCYLLQPQTYMNQSGECVASFFRYYGLSPKDLLVIYDDLDLEPYQIRLKVGGRSGGHKGIESINQALGPENQNYYRLKIGIGHPRRLTPPGRISPSDYVLQNFSETEQSVFSKHLGDIISAIELILVGEFQIMMQRYHTVAQKESKRLQTS